MFNMQQHTIPTPYQIGEVHCYSTEIDGELVLFDSGPPTAEALASLKAQVNLSRLRYLFLTHCHIDHLGLATMLADHSDATILLPRSDALKLRRYSESLEHLARLLAELGCDTSISEYIRKKSENENLFKQLLGKFQIVEESDVPSRLGIKWLSCPGHSQSDIVYLCGQHAITGDTLLRNIFQVPILEIDLETFDGRFHNYNAYCKSIKSLAQLRDRIIHPGHRGYVEGVNTTILFYVKKLLKLATRIRKGPCNRSPIEITESLFGIAKKNPFFFHMKFSEIVFALDFLEDPHKLKASLESVELFEEIGELFDEVLETAQAIAS